MLCNTRPAARSAGRLLIVCCLFANGLPAAAQIRTVALTGQQVPGAPFGTTFTAFSLFGINDLGQTAMTAETDAGQHLLVEDSGAFRTVARQGEAPPDAPGGSAFGIPFAVLNDVGQVAFFGEYSFDSRGKLPGVWSESGGTLHAVALFV